MRLVLMFLFLTALTATTVAFGTDRIPPPIYDFCDLIAAQFAPDQGDAEYAGDTCDGEQIVLDYDCEVFSTQNGREDYYAVQLRSGCAFTATVAHDGDAVLMVTDECIVFGTMFTCLAVADDTGPGGTETISFTHDGVGERTVYLVVDSGREEDCGTYVAIFEMDCPVPTETLSFGALKRGYR